MQRNKAINAFLLIWVLYTICLGAAVLSTEQLELHRIMHRCTSGSLDTFFSSITHVGDGLVPTILAVLILLLADVRSFLMIGLSTGLSAIVTQVLKHALSYDRPFMFRDELGDMHWVPGLDLHHHLSFPSGHTTAAFSMCFAMAVLLGRASWGYALAILAALLAYSRVYISQHFSEDILAGAAIGTLTGLAVYYWLYRSAFATRPWLNRRVYTPR